MDASPPHLETDHQTPQFLYHWKPEGMVGNVIYPLNRLKDIYPDIYQRQVEKYEGREVILDLHVPTLDCKWNDTVFLSPVGPEQMKAALLEVAGYDFGGDFYEIEAKNLDPAKASLYTFKDVSFDAISNPANYLPYTPANLAAASVLPEATKQYYRENFAPDSGGLFFVYIPHALYKGEINIGNSRIITV